MTECSLGFLFCLIHPRKEVEEINNTEMPADVDKISFRTGLLSLAKEPGKGQSRKKKKSKNKTY